MSEESKAVLLRLFEDILNGNNLGVLDEIVSPDFVNHSPSMGVTSDREGWRTSLGRILTSLPDMRYQVYDLIGEGELAALRFTAEATHQGEIFGAAATGKTVRWAGIFICRVVDGKMVERWELRTDLTMLQQLGSIRLAG